MRFLYPALLTWGFLILAPIVLYLFRRKPKRVRVSTLIFFKSLARAYQESAWLRILKRLLSLLLQILIIAFAVGTLARPVVAPRAGSLRSVVVLIDRSASMAARDDSGRPRLAAAIGRVRQRLAGLSAGVGVMVMAYDRRPEILLPFSFDHREVERTLAKIEVRPIEGEPEAALRLAARMAELETPASIWHATDSAIADHRLPTTDRGRASAPDPGLGEGSAPASTVGVDPICVGLPSPANVGITAFQLRRLPLERSRFQAFVQVHASAPEPLEAELEIRIDDALVAVRSLTLKPDSQERLLVPANAGEGTVLTLKVSARGDVLPLDDAVHARIPPLRPIRVLWLGPSPDPFTELALASLGKESDVEVYKGSPSAWPPQEMGDATGSAPSPPGGPDVVIFDKWLPEAWPTRPAVIVISPRRSLGPVRAAPIEGTGLPVDTVRATDDHHPVLYGVATARVSVTQTAVVEPDGTLEPLWVGPSGPLLIAGEAGGQRVVVMAFEPERSEHLPLLASYPLLVGNAVFWAGDATDTFDPRGGGPRSGNNRRTGDLVALEGKSLTWSLPGRRDTDTVGLGARWTELDRLGLWETDAGETGGASLLSRRETQLVAAPDDAAGHDGARGVMLFRGDLSRVLAWLVLLVLLLECWLFHRHAVY